MVRMNRISSSVLCVIAMLTGPLAAKAADSFDLPRWYTGLNGGYYFNEGDDLETGQEYNLVAGYNFNSRWAVEGNLGLVPNARRDEEPGESSVGVKFAGDALYMLSEPGLHSIDPYVSAGAGVIIYDKGWVEGSADPYAGIGLGAYYNVNEQWFLRPDYRVHAELKDASRIDHEVLLTLGYRWGSTLGGTGESQGSFDEAKGIGDINSMKDLDKVYFAYDSSKLDEKAKMSLQKNAKWLQANEGKNVTVAGYCDERGTNDYNMALGMRRAQSAFDYLRSLGIQADRLSTISYGEEFPADPGHNESAWSKNRRAEFIMGKK